MSEEGPKCDKCGLECTTGMMAAFCSQGRQCEFWPHSNGDPALAGGELLMYRFWMDNALEQIGLQIEERKRLETDAARYRWVRRAAYRSNGHLCINADARPDDIKTVDDFDAMVDAELAADSPHSGVHSEDRGA